MSRMRHAHLLLAPACIVCLAAPLAAQALKASGSKLDDLLTNEPLFLETRGRGASEAVEQLLDSVRWSRWGTEEEGLLDSLISESARWRVKYAVGDSRELERALKRKLVKQINRLAPASDSDEVDSLADKIVEETMW